MTQVVWERAPGSSLMRMTASGHSGYAAEGSDIICAAVSAAMALLDRNLTELGARRGGRCGDGYQMVEGAGWTAWKLMRVTAEFLRALAYQYPDFINFTEKNLDFDAEWGEMPPNTGL